MHSKETKHGKSKKLLFTWKNSCVFHELKVEKGRIDLFQIIVRIGLYRAALHLLTNGQRFETQGRNLDAMRILAELSYERNTEIDKHLFIRPGIIFFEVANLFIR
ncbi:MAG: hypothetical protein EZS28_023593 [Streblomastix strix]|uniref:Uncharacterized protein n=1 Tax=Streblomastix strix TaxID=222440 RepID=A0A5J4VE65_9EUKA|nr:MAG: hypothetical protein EZS28_023593 [Streblomastix strix]